MCVCACVCACVCVPAFFCSLFPVSVKCSNRELFVINPKSPWPLNWSAANNLCRKHGATLASDPKIGFRVNYKSQPYWKCAVNLLQSLPHLVKDDLRIWTSSCPLPGKCGAFVLDRSANQTVFMDNEDSSSPDRSFVALCERSKLGM